MVAFPEKVARRPSGVMVSASPAHEELRTSVPTPRRSPGHTVVVRIRFWGTRGSVPTPGPGTVRYGGNTSCVEVRTDGGTLLVLDCGTGARGLGLALMEEAAASDSVPAGAILIGHTHWDHIHGLPFFAPLFVPGSRWDVFGPRGLSRTLDQVLAGQMEYQYFPVGLDEVSADVHYHDLVEGVFEVGDATVTTRYLNHPALTVGYRIEADGATVVYASDHEPHDSNLAAGGRPHPGGADDRHAAFLGGADVVVHDAQYDEDGYSAKVGWGHSTMEYAVDLALAVDVKRLVLFHHDPSRHDDSVDALVKRARGRVVASGGSLVVDAAAEGATIDVIPTGGAEPTSIGAAAATAVPAVERLAVGVVVITSDPTLGATVSAAAAAEGLAVRSLEQGDLADAVAVVDLDDGSLDEIGLDEIGGALSLLGVTRRAIPVTGATPTVVSDWLVLPCSMAHVRTKLRAAVLRRACQWLAAPVAPDEPRRLAALHSLGLLDSPPEERFDKYAEQARRIADAPIALVTLVDAERQWFKSRAGFDLVESHRDLSICAHAILGRDVFQVPDTLQDGRFADSPAVTGPTRVRFYAGVPLALADGSRVGTLCVADHRPRLLGERQLAELRGLAERVALELQRR
jgi:phosphoribosyl 1,2-cyclic phosphodiesterase